MADVVGLFAERLAAKLGRTARDLRKQGLEAADFRVNEDVRMILCGGSTLSFRHAFAVVDPERHIVGVFTEHFRPLAERSNRRTDLR